jgi:hypothetical protein
MIFDKHSSFTDFTQRYALAARAVQPAPTQ